MSWWGKIVGGTFGFMMGGPLGAVMGAALGNYFDGGLEGIALDDSLGIGATERVQSAFLPPHLLLWAISPSRTVR